jgi:hypothetical protein
MFIKKFYDILQNETICKGGKISNNTNPRTQEKYLMKIFPSILINKIVLEKSLKLFLLNPATCYFMIKKMCCVSARRLSIHKTSNKFRISLLNNCKKDFQFHTESNFFYTKYKIFFT